MQRSTIVLAIVSVFFATCGCAPDEECRKENIIRMKAMLYTQSFNETKKTYTPVEHTPDSLSVWGLGNDSLLYDRAQTNYVYLPLNKNAASSTFVLHYWYSPDENTHIDAQDTLVVSFVNTNTYISLECGCFVYQTLQDFQFTRHALDSIEVLNQQVNTFDEEHIRLYY